MTTTSASSVPSPWSHGKDSSSTTATTTTTATNTMATSSLVSSSSPLLHMLSEELLILIGVWVGAWCVGGEDLHDNNNNNKNNNNNNHQNRNRDHNNYGSDHDSAADRETAEDPTASDNDDSDDDDNSSTTTLDQFMAMASANGAIQPNAMDSSFTSVILGITGWQSVARLGLTCRYWYRLVYDEPRIRKTLATVVYGVPWTDSPTDSPTVADGRNIPNHQDNNNRNNNNNNNNNRLHDLALYHSLQYTGLWAENRIWFDFASTRVEDPVVEGNNDNDNNNNNTDQHDHPRGSNLQRIRVMAYILSTFMDCALLLDSHCGISGPVSIAARVSGARGLMVADEIARLHAQRADQRHRCRRQQQQQQQHVSTSSTGHHGDHNDHNSDQASVSTSSSVETIDHRMGIIPWGQSIAWAAASDDCQHPYAALARAGKGWVELRIRVGTGNRAREWPPRPDFYTSSTANGMDNNDDSDGSELVQDNHDGMYEEMENNYFVMHWESEATRDEEDEEEGMDYGEDDSV